MGNVKEINVEIDKEWQKTFNTGYLAGIGHCLFMMKNKIGINNLDDAIFHLNYFKKHLESSNG